MDKVFCEECEHHYFNWSKDILHHECKLLKAKNPIRMLNGDCLDLNHNNLCRSFKQIVIKEKINIFKRLINLIKG